jgi:hypothetical protein
MAPGTPDPAQFLGIRLPMTFDTCEVIEERWENWMRHNPVVAVETQREISAGSRRSTSIAARGISSTCFTVPVGSFGG